MKNKLRVTVIFLIVFLISPSVAFANYDIGFGGVGPGTGEIDLDTPITGFPPVTSQWNQPRSIGTNPHPPCFYVYES